MRILSIHPDSPYGASSGVNIRNRTIVKALAQHGEVTVLAFDDPSKLDHGQGARVLRLAKRTSGPFWRTQNPFRPLSHVFNRDERRQIADVVKSVNPDFAIVEGVGLRDCLGILRKLGIPTVLDTHNVESQVFPQILLQSPRWYWPQYIVRSLAKLASAKFEETSTLAKANHIWACSAPDATALGQMSGKLVSLVGNPIPDAKPLDLPITTDRYQCANLVFTGHLTYRPNSKAIRVLTGEIAPNLPEGARLTIAGRAVSDKQRQAISHAGGILVDAPPDMLPILADASYTILPITSGGGTRIKVLEALAAGVLVIATAKAVENLGLVDGKHFIHAETPAEMIAALVRMQSAPEKAVEIATAGRKFVVATHSFEAISEAVTRALRAAKLI